MEREELGAGWGEVIAEAVTGLRDWRAAHPRVSFAEIEAAVEERLSRVRAQMLEEAALASRAAALAPGGEGGQERPTCTACGTPLEARGEQVRDLRVQGNQRVRLRRRYATCPGCGRGLFPPG